MFGGLKIVDIFGGLGKTRSLGSTKHTVSRGTQSRSVKCLYASQCIALLVELQ